MRSREVSRGLQSRTARMFYVASAVGNSVITNQHTPGADRARRDVRAGVQVGAGGLLEERDPALAHVMLRWRKRGVRSPAGSITGFPEGLIEGFIPVGLIGGSILADSIAGWILTSCADSGVMGLIPTW